MKLPKRAKQPEPKETLILRAILTYLKVIKCLAWRMPVQASLYSKAGEVSFRRSPITGFPDIAALYRGVFVCFEVKRAGGKVSPHQDKWLNDLQNNGAVARVVRSVEDVQSVLAEIDDLIDNQPVSITR